jgi:hypothetical protein
MKNPHEAADFSMPDAFAKDYLDRIIKKTIQEEKQNLVTLLLMFDCQDTRAIQERHMIFQTSLLRQTLM